MTITMWTRVIARNARVILLVALLLACSGIVSAANAFDSLGTGVDTTDTGVPVFGNPLPNCYPVQISSTQIGTRGSTNPVGTPQGTNPGVVIGTNTGTPIGGHLATSNSGRRVTSGNGRGTNGTTGLSTNGGTTGVATNGGIVGRTDFGVGGPQRDLGTGHFGDQLGGGNGAGTQLGGGSRAINSVSHPNDQTNGTSNFEQGAPDVTSGQQIWCDPPQIPLTSYSALRTLSNLGFGLSLFLFSLFLFWESVRFRKRADGIVNEPSVLVLSVSLAITLVAAAVIFSYFEKEMITRGDEASHLKILETFSNLFAPIAISASVVPLAIATTNFMLGFVALRSAERKATAPEEKAEGEKQAETSAPSGLGIWGAIISALSTILAVLARTFLIK